MNNDIQKMENITVGLNKEMISPKLGNKHPNNDIKIGRKQMNEE